MLTWKQIYRRKKKLLVLDRTYLRITEQESSFLPFDVSSSQLQNLIESISRSPISCLQILLQAIASLFVIIYSLLHVVGDFKEIRAAVDLQGKSWETLSNIPSFYTFNHRGKALSPSYVEPSSTGKASLESDDWLIDWFLCMMLI